MPKQKSPRQVAQEQAITYLAHGLPVAQVAEKIGRNKNSIYRWMKLPKFAERLRVEVERDMFGAKRELGAIARRSIASAGQSLDQLERMRDNPNETSAARDRAAHRLLQHAFKWGEVLDPELSSNDASGRGSCYAPRDYIRETESLTYRLERAVQIIGMLETAMRDSKAPMPDNIAGMVNWMGLQDYTVYVQNLKDSEILKRKSEATDDAENSEDSKVARDPEKAEKQAAAEARDRRDAERRAKYRASELAGTEKPDDIDEEGEVKAKDDAAPPKQNSGSAVTNVPTPNVPPVPTAPGVVPVKYPRYLGE